MLRRIGTGSYGEVWLARNVLGSLRAIKVVFRGDFDTDRPYEREFNGILKYEPVSREHPGHVDILQVGRNEQAGYFYYVMELADDAAGGNADPECYKPRTLKTEAQRRGRLPVAECVQLGLALGNALDHLHQRGLVHRDIKPANVIFIEGRPALADIGLVTHSDGTTTRLGTEGYLPPEGAGVPQADLFSLGKVLYELATGLDRKQFPELPADLATWTERKEFLALNRVISRACASNPAERYSSAAELLADLSRLTAEGRSTRRARAGLAAAAIVAVAASTATVVWWPRGSNQTPPAAAAALHSTNHLADGAAASGWRLLERRTQADLHTAMTDFRSAIHHDTNCASAWAGLALVSNDMERQNRSLPKVVRPRALASATTALAIEPDNVHALTALGDYFLSFERNWTAAETNLARAVSLSPDHPRACLALAELRAVQGQFPAASVLALRALSQTNLAPWIRMDLAWVLWCCGDSARALSLMSQVTLDDPATPTPNNVFMIMLETEGREQEFFDASERHARALNRGPDYRAGYVEAFQTEGSRGMRRVMLQRIAGSMSPISRANNYCRLGDMAAAYKELEQSVAEQRKDVIFLGVSPQWAIARKDPRWPALAEKIGLPFQRSAE